MCGLALLLVSKYIPRYRCAKGVPNKAEAWTKRVCSGQCVASHPCLLSWGADGVERSR